MAKSEVNLNWLWIIDYGLLIVNIMRGQFSWFDANALTGFMISAFLAARAPRVRRARNLMGKSVRNGLTFFLLFRKKYYFIQKLSFLINNLFGNVFQTPLLKKYFNSWKKYFLVWHFIENQVFIVTVLFPCFSTFSLLMLI